jgi:hypothetical protein
MVRFASALTGSSPIVERRLNRMRIPAVAALCRPMLGKTEECADSSTRGPRTLIHASRADDGVLSCRSVCTILGSGKIGGKLLLQDDARRLETVDCICARR